jgi:formiminoglutamase
MIPFQIAGRTYIDGLINKRPGETKLGEQVQTVHEYNWEEELHNSDARFALMGIPEDIGVRANYGRGGTQTMWEPALRAILNVQDSRKLQGDDILVLGAFDFTELLHETDSADVHTLRQMVVHIDEAVSALVQKVIIAGKIPIVIGGGHNNAYPLLQAVTVVTGKKANCINLDAHSDYRMMEGRHSGNGFHYARKKGYLDKFAMIGLHENYNSQYIMDALDGDKAICYSTYDDIFIKEQQTFSQSIRAALQHTAGGLRGIELDLDCIEHVLSSAATPCGINTIQARQYITQCAIAGNAAYLHLPEGAVKVEGVEDMSTAKLIAYLVTDFLRAYS